MQTLTIGEHALEVADYITGRQYQEIQDVYLSGAKVSGGGIEDFNGAVVNKAINLGITMVVKSMDGSGDTILDRVLDLPSDEYEEIAKYVDKITGGLEKKTIAAGK